MLFFVKRGGHQLVDCADKIAKKPSIATLASLETLEMIEQKQNWMDDPILVAVAKSNLAVLRAQEGIRERVFRIRGGFRRHLTPGDPQPRVRDLTQNLNGP